MIDWILSLLGVKRLPPKPRVPKAPEALTILEVYELLFIECKDPRYVEPHHVMPSGTVLYRSRHFPHMYQFLAPVGRGVYDFKIRSGYNGSIKTMPSSEVQQKAAWDYLDYLEYYLKNSPFKRVRDIPIHAFEAYFIRDKAAWNSDFTVIQTRDGSHRWLLTPVTIKGYCGNIQWMLQKQICQWEDIP